MFLPLDPAVAAPLAAAAPPAAEVRPAGDRPGPSQDAQGGLMVDAGGEVRGPPPDPGAEPRLAADPSGVAAKCEATQTLFNGRSHGQTLRAVISRNAQWGVVWRADFFVTPDHSGQPFRFICWKTPASGEVQIKMRPLQMFDPTQSIKPLEAGTAP